MSFIKIWVHLVFSTKNREPYLQDNFRDAAIKHIEANCKEKNIFLKSIGGYTDHLHCLISLGKDQSVSQVAQLIKGESSFWINKNNYTPYKFVWQDDYYGASISHSHLDSVCSYIRHQQEHHRKRSFTQEIDEFLNEHGFEIIK